MKYKYIFILLFTFITSVALARPYPDRLVICYEFKNNKLVQRQPCVESTGYGAGGSYTFYSFGQKEYYIETNTMKPEGDMQINGQKATLYTRDASFFNILKGKPMKGEKYLFCYKTKDGKIDICAFNPYSDKN